MLAADGNLVNSRQLIEYSLNGEDWTLLRSFDDFTITNHWYDATVELPADASNKDNVYVRWIADPSSSQWATPDTSTDP